MPVITVDPVHDPRWLTLLTGRRSDLFHSPAWLAVLADTYGFAPHALLLLDDDARPVAGVPYCEIDDILGRRRVCLPFSDYCDPLVTEAAQWKMLADVLLAAGTPVTIRPLHESLVDADGRFTAVKEARWHGLTLPADEETLWQRLHGSARRAIRKSEQAGVVVREATYAELRRFFEMHVGVRKHKYRLIAQPYRFFDRIWHHLIEKGDGRLLVADYHSTLIGAVLFLDWHGCLYYKFNASHPDYLHLRPNDLIMWTGLRDACRHGYTHADFGLSDIDQPGLIRYKLKFADREKTIRFLRYDAGQADDPAAARLRATFGRLTDLLTDTAVPDDITAQAGDILYRFFT